MHISNYQMHNVLNVYTKQLSQTGSTKESKTEFRKTLTDQIDLSPGGKRKSMIEKVSDQILNKISELGNKVAADSYERNNLEDQSAPAAGPEKSNGNEFVFNVIDKVNHKKTTTYSTTDINFLMNSIEQLAKKFVEKEGA